MGLKTIATQIRKDLRAKGLKASVRMVRRDSMKACSYKRAELVRVTPDDWSSVDEIKAVRDEVLSRRLNDGYSAVVC